MPIDPSISLAAGHPPNGQQNPLTTMLGQTGQVASIMNAMNQAKLFNFTMQGREGISKALSGAISPDGDVDLAKFGQGIIANPGAAHMAPEALQALTAMKQTQLQTAKLKLEGFQQVTGLITRSLMSRASQEGTQWGDVVSDVTGIARQVKDSFGTTLGIDPDKMARDFLASFTAPGGGPAATLTGTALQQALKLKALEFAPIQEKLQAISTHLERQGDVAFGYNPYLNRNMGPVAVGGTDTMQGQPGVVLQQPGGAPVSGAPEAGALPPARTRVPGQVDENGFDQHQRLAVAAEEVDRAQIAAGSAPAQGANDPDAVLARVVKNDGAQGSRPGAIATGPTTQRAEYISGKGDVADYRNTWSKTLDIERQFNMRAQEIAKLAKQVETGAGRSTGVAAAAIVGTLANMAKSIAAGVGVDIEKDPKLKEYFDRAMKMKDALAGGKYEGADGYASAQQFIKYAVQGGTEALRAAMEATGNHIALMEWQAFQTANINIDTEPEAVKHMLAFAKSQLDRDEKRMEYVSKYTQGVNGRGASPAPNMESLQSVLGAMMRKHGWVEGTGPTPNEAEPRNVPTAPGGPRSPEEFRRMMYGG